MEQTKDATIKKINLLKYALSINFRLLKKTPEHLMVHNEKKFHKVIPIKKKIKVEMPEILSIFFFSKIFFLTKNNQLLI